MIMPAFACPCTSCPSGPNKLHSPPAPSPPLHLGSAVALGGVLVHCVSLPPPPPSLLYLLLSRRNVEEMQSERPNDPKMQSERSNSPRCLSARIQTPRYGHCFLIKSSLSLSQGRATILPKPPTGRKHGLLLPTVRGILADVSGSHRDKLSQGAKPPPKLMFGVVLGHAHVSVLACVHARTLARSRVDTHAHGTTTS